MGEESFVPSQTNQACQEAIPDQCEQAAQEVLRVKTAGDVFEVQWNTQGKATAMGQLAFFAEFLETSGMFERWLQSCPLRYTSPNAPRLVDVLGTWLLGILDGHSRYAHIGALRGDGVRPDVLGMSKIIGDDIFAEPWQRSHRCLKLNTTPKNVLRSKPRPCKLSWG